MSTDINWDSELKWRPESYTEFDDPVALVLNGIRGQMRREMARDMLIAEGEHREFIDTQLGPIQAGILEERADERFIHTMSAFESPIWMGGEYLPDVDSSEVEIARIVLRSTLMDVISIRARWRWGRYHYRIVDEHEMTYNLSRKSSNKPLTLGQLIDLLWKSYCEGWDYNPYGMVEGFWEDQRVYGCPAFLEDCVNFAYVESDFYPRLSDWYDQRGKEWIAEQAEEEEE